MINQLLKNYPDIPKIIQDETKATYKPKRNPEDGEVNLNMKADEIDRYVRALQGPYPPAYIINNHGEKIYLLKIKIDEK